MNVTRLRLWAMNQKKEEHPRWALLSVCGVQTKIVRKSFGEAEKAHDEWFSWKKVVEKFGNSETSVLSL